MSFLSAIKFVFGAPILGGVAGVAGSDLVQLLRLLTAIYVPTLFLLLWQNRKMKRQLASNDGSDAKKKKQEDLANKIMEDLRVQLVDERKKRLALEKDFSEEKAALEKTLSSKAEELLALTGRHDSVVAELRAQIGTMETEIKKLSDAVARETDRANEATIDVTSEKTKAEKIDRELQKEREKSKKLELQCDRARKEIEDLNAQLESQQKTIQQLKQQDSQSTARDLNLPTGSSASKSGTTSGSTSGSSLQARSPPSTAVLDLLSDLERSLAQVDSDFDASPATPLSGLSGDRESALRQSAEALDEIERALEEVDRQTPPDSISHAAHTVTTESDGEDNDFEEFEDGEEEEAEYQPLIDEEEDEDDEGELDSSGAESGNKPAPVPLPTDAGRSIMAGGTRAGPKRRVSFVDPNVRKEMAEREANALAQNSQSYADISSPAAASSSPVVSVVPTAAADDDKLFRSFAVREDPNLSTSAGKGGGFSGSRKRIGGHGSGPEQMEDQNAVLWPIAGDQDMALFGIFDGHGGKEAAIDAKELFPLEWTKKMLLQENRNATELSAAFVQCYATVDQQMARHEYMGCTATTVFVWRPRGNSQRYLQCANVGDSSAYLIRNNEAVMLSFDHKVSDKREKDRIRAMGIEVHDTQGRVGGLAVSRALGDHYPKSERCGLIGEPHCSESIPLLASDTLLIMASDGLWDCMDGKAAYELIREAGAADDANAAASVLISAALKNSKCRDNVTVLVVRL